LARLSRCILVSNLLAIAWPIFLFVVLLSFSRVEATSWIGIASTSYRIELYPNRSALWQITYSVPLLDMEDMALFGEYVKNFTSSKQAFLDSFEQQMAQVVGQAANLTGRKMFATNFEACAMIVSTPTVSRGTITYRFLWNEFLEGSGSILYMGDAFEGGLYLYENESITVIPPSGYRACYVSPQPDALNGAITWHGPKNFPSGEPAIEFLSMETKLYIEFLDQEAMEFEQVTVQGRIEPPLAVPILIIYTKPDGSTFNQTVMASNSGSFTSKVSIDEAGTWYVQATWEGNREYYGSSSQIASFHARPSFNVYALLPFLLPFASIPVALVILYRRRAKRTFPPPPVDDEEKVVALLRSAGGQMLQKDIARKLGFSKSKTTGILNELEAKNVIEKEKKGREYIVKLR